jgi:hypothetical protein
VNCHAEAVRRISGADQALRESEELLVLCLVV